MQADQTEMGGEMKITKDYILNEVQTFWDIMGNREYSVEQVSNALRGLLVEYANYDGRDKKLDSVIALACDEHDRRLALRLKYGI